MPRSKKNDDPIIDEERNDEINGDAPVTGGALIPDVDGPAAEDLEEEEVDEGEDLLSQDQYFDDASEIFFISAIYCVSVSSSSNCCGSNCVRCVGG